jgi:hypothetical protein
MAKIAIKQGATSVSVNIFIADSSSSTGAGLSGLVFNTSGLTAYYMRPKVAATAITLATLAAVTSAYSSGGFKEIDATNAKGWYRFDIPDAVIANAERFVDVHFQGATNMAPLPLEIELTTVDNQDGAAFGLSRLDAAVTSRMATYTQPTGFLAASFPGSVAAAFTLPTNFSSLSIDASGRVDLGKWIGTAPNALISGRVDANAQVVGDKTAYSLSQAFPTNFSSLSIDATGRVDLAKWIGVAPNALISGRVDANAGVIGDKTGYALTAADKLAIWQVSTSLMTGAGEIGKRVVDFLTGDAYARLGAPAGASVSADIAAAKTDTAAIKLQTDKLQFNASSHTLSDIRKINNTTVNGDGAGTPWGP